MKVTKRDGTLEELDYSKIDNHLEYACQGLDNAHPSEIEMNAVIQFNDGMSTVHIQDILIQSAINLAQTKQQYIVAAGRLYLQQLRKQAYGKYWNPPTIKEHINKNMFNSRYSLKLLQYSAYELEELEKVVNHSLDEQMGYAAIKTYGDKYLLSTKRNGKVFETPQMANILRFMTGLVNVPNRLERIKKIYKIYNENKFSLASPTMRAMRTNTEQYNSCAVMKLDDNLESFDAVNGSILALSSKMYGLGLDGSSIRRLGADIRNGEAVHTGSVNFIKMFEATLNSCSQGGMRKGSMTYYFPIWHYDVQDLVMLRDHGGTDETRCRTLNYAVQMHGLFWKKFLNDEEIVLFSPHDVKDLYEAFFKPAYPNQFEELYELYSNDESIPKRKIEARILMSTVAQQMYQTGKIFIANVDLMNSHTPFKDDAIYSSNLCMEIALPTKPIVNTKNDPDGLISLCTLAAVNWSAHKSVEELDDTMDSLVEFLNEGLHSQQSYLVPAKNSTDWFAPLGIGVNNFAHFMAKNDLRYGEPNALSVVHEWIEATYYYALKASVNYAKQNPDRVPSKIDRTIYSDGCFVFEQSKLQERFPEFCSDWTLKQNWDDLSFDMREYGIANATVLAMMPGETSSVVQQMTNSLEGVNFDKESTSGNLKFVPQDYDLLKDKFQKMFEIPNGDYLKTTAVVQKFTDQAISINLDYTRNENDMNDVDEVLYDMLFAYMLGNKTIYYTNTRSSSEHMYKEQETAEQECEGCSI